MSKPQSFISRKVLALLLGVITLAVFPLAFLLVYFVNGESRQIALSALSAYLAAPFGAFVYVMMLRFFHLERSAWLKAWLFAFFAPIIPYVSLLMLDYFAFKGFWNLDYHRSTPLNDFSDPIPFYSFNIFLLPFLNLYVFAFMYIGQYTHKHCLERSKNKDKKVKSLEVR